MIEIQIAGAGAGKTFGLAKSVIAHSKACSDHKKIFALTYTNSATSKIEQEIIEQYGFIPSNLYIQTVHSFLLNEIVYPFSSFTLGDVYNDASIMMLPADVRLKNWQIKRLKERNIIHAEKVYNISKQIVDETTSKHNTKVKKSRVRRLLNILTNCFDKIFIDEVQDLDGDALRFFEILGSNGIDIYMIGDPKQAIKYPQELDLFIKRISLEKYVHIHDINNLTRRVPKEILNISNRFCYEKQQQESLSEVIGELMYLESTDERYYILLEQYISTNQIVCIDKKVGKYSTSTTPKYSFPRDVEDMIRDSNHKKDKALVVKAAFSDFINDIQKYGDKKAITMLISRHSIQLEKAHFAQLYDFCRSYNENDTQFKVKSIDSIKGLDADTCVIILTPNLLKYLIQTDLKSIETFNKEWKKVYVALTRSKKRIVLAIDHELFINHDMKKIKSDIKSLGFFEHC
ncbi:UvrD-helicase domain-containing protein [Providencia rettgeri]